MAGTRELENEAESLLRHAATDRLPVDAGVVGQLMHVIGDAYDLGQREIRELAEAELRELLSMGILAGPDEVQAVRDFLKRLTAYGVPE